MPAAIHADPLRLRGDAFVQTRSPVGLLVLRGEDRLKPWIDLETVAWVGARHSPEVSGDVQTLTVRLRNPAGEVRIGRFVFASGAIRPLHLDGVRALGRAPFGTTLEIFGGAPVAPRLGSRMFDSAFGGRIGQPIGSFAVLGVSYLMQRRDGTIADEEVGPDLAISPTKNVDLVSRLAVDLVTRGVADALVSIGAHSGDVRAEGFLTHRSPSRILPSTSIFTVLGDIPSTTFGGTLRYKIAPRLDLLGTGGGIAMGKELGGFVTARATLALDDDALGTLGVELRRQYVSTARWSGARVLLGLPLGASVRLATEVEAVRHDDGRFWPWALLALAYRAPRGWDFVAGVEAVTTRDERRELHALGRISYAFERSR
jgi:hypothetical protein